MAAHPVPPPANTPDPLEQVRDLEARFAAAMNQLYAVGNGLAQVRQSLDTATAQQAPSPTPVTGPAKAPAPAPAPVPGPGLPTAPTMTPGLPPEPAAAAGTPQAAAGTPQAAAGTPQAAAAPAPPTTHWWERPGAVSRILGGIGAVVTLVGIALLLAIAIAAGIFGPVPRVIAGALLAGGLLAGGWYARRRWPQTAGGQALAATGLAAAYLDILAATSLYEFIPGSVGLLLAALIASGAFLLARAWDSQLLAAIAVAPPALLAPSLTGFDSLATISFVALLLVFSGLAHAGRGWGWLYVVRTVPAVGVLLVGVGAQYTNTFPVTAVTAATALAMIAVGTLERADRLQHHPTAAAIAAATPLLLLIARTDDHALAITAGLAVVFLAVAALLTHTGAGAHPGAEAGISTSLRVAPLVIGTVLVIMAASELSDILVSGLVLALAAAAYWLIAGARRDWPMVIMGMALAAVSAATFTPTVLATTSLVGLEVLQRPLSIALGAALTALAWLGARTTTAVRGGHREPALTVIASLSAFVTASTTVVATGTWIGSLVGEAQVGFYGGHAVATALWTALAAVLITVISRRSADRGVMVRLGLALIAVAIAKLFLFDLSALDGLFRVVAFIVTGIIVLVVGVTYARATEEVEQG